MLSARTLTICGVVAALGACAPETPQSPLVMVVPGKGRDPAAFQQDDLICRQHAAARTGYDKAPAAAAGNTAGSGNPPPDVSPANQVAYVQCMAARGDTVQPEPPAYADAGEPYGVALPYGYGYPYPYPYYGYGYPYGFYGGGLFAGFGWGGWHHGGWYHGGWGGHGFAHAGYGHGGCGHGGGHGGGHR